MYRTRKRTGKNVSRGVSVGWNEAEIEGGQSKVDRKTVQGRDGEA